MKMKSKIKLLFIASCAFSGIALADASYTLDLHRLDGHFSCSVNAKDDAEVIIDTYKVKVKGPNCDGHTLHTTAKDLNQFAYYWKRDGLEPSVKITVNGDAESLICKDEQQGRPEAPGGEC